MVWAASSGTVFYQLPQHRVHVFAYPRGASKHFFSSYLFLSACKISRHHIFGRRAASHDFSVSFYASIHESLGGSFFMAFDLSFYIFNFFGTVHCNHLTWSIYWSFLSSFRKGEGEEVQKRGERGICTSLLGNGWSSFFFGFQNGYRV